MNNHSLQRKVLIRILGCYLSIFSCNVLISAPLFNSEPPSKKIRLELSQLMTDNMVLQRGMDNLLWGWAGKSSSINVYFLGKTFTADHINEKERWEIRLPSMNAGGPYEMMIEDGIDTFKIHNIMFGDVWLCAGQSNMELKINYLKNRPIEEGDNSLRYFDVSSQVTIEEQSKLPPKSGSWLMCSSETIDTYSAVGYYFAKEIRKHNKDVAIGILDASYSNSRLNGWISAEKLGRKKFNDLIKGLEEDYSQPISRYAMKFTGEVDWEKINVAYDTQKTIQIPNYWEHQGLVDFNGYVWFQKKIVLTSKEASEDGVLSLGKINESDFTYINGKFVGKVLQNYKKKRAYRIPAKYLVSGENLISVRVEDWGGLGGIYGAEEALYFSTQKRRISLVGEWKHRIGGTRIGSKTATVVYNSMIHPLTDYGIKGVLWYQGESDDGEELAFNYRKNFPLLVNDWRTKWGIDQLPFLCVQLPNFNGNKPLFDRVTLRESQTLIAENLTNVEQIITIDIGNPDNDHPYNKREVGERLALIARNVVYEEPIICFGPSYSDFSIEGDTIIINFNNVQEGFMVKDKYGYQHIRGFKIAGKDKKFHWAKARIKDGHVMVWNEQVQAPLSVRYAWENNPTDANLYNRKGLPTTPFRLDNW